MSNIITIRGFTNNFLIKFKEGFLLIDSFLPPKYNRFQQKLRKLGIQLNEIKYLLLTHHHVDHAACVIKLREQTSLKLIVHKEAIKYLEEGINEEYTKPLNFAFKIIMPFVKKILGKKYPKITLRKEDIIIDGDKSEVLKEKLDLDAIILRTPGSTKDNLSVVFSDGNAITGDIVTNFLHIFGLKNRPPLITTLDEVYSSWDLLIKSEARFLYPSHGKPFQIETLIKRRSKLRKK